LFAGILLSVTASVAFGLLSYYSVFLLPLDGYGIFAWRVIFTLLVLTLVLSLRQRWPAFVAEIKALKQQPYAWPAMLFCSTLIAVQLGLFGWAPVNGQGQALAMGYFLLPLSLVLTGRLMYGEQLSALRKVAVGLALLGVVAGLITKGGFSPVSLLVMLGFPPYFMVRKRMRLNALNGMLAEHILMIPLALIILSLQDFNPHYFSHKGWLGWPVLLGLGLVSTTALLSYMGASQRLPLVLFGMLGYVEPLLLFAVALMLGEAVTAMDMWTYIPIWLAVLCLVLEGSRQLIRQHRGMI
tara:strand:+ start:68765 stop:69655 length:891 start_codon:yes stop_codon:yes gene_type:complete